MRAGTRLLGGTLVIICYLTACGVGGTPEPPTPTPQGRATQIAQLTQVAVAIAASAEARAQPTVALARTPTPRPVTPTFVPASAALGALGAPLTLAVAPVPDGVPYLDEAGRFSLLLPAAWQNLGPQNGMEVSFGPSADPSEDIGVGVVLQPMPVGYHSAEGYDEIIAILLAQVAREMPGYERVSFGHGELAGAPVYRHIFRSTINGARLEQVEYYYPISGVFHNIVAGSAVENFDAQLPLFEAIAMSYRVGATR